jgi:PAS domain S-box-containing protein
MMRYKIIITGDNIRTLTVLRKTLELFINEFSVTTVPSENDFTIISKEEIPDIIIMNFDDFMEAGIKSISRIRHNPILRNVPILMATGFLSGEVQKAIETGADDFIKKPIERVELLLRIKYLVQRHKMHMKNLHQSMELKKMSLVADRTENSVLITNPGGELEWVNKAFEKLYEYSLKDFKQHFGNYIQDFSPKFSEALRKCRNDRKWVVYENFWTTRTGNKKWIQTSLTPVLNNEGEITNFIAVETDITSLKLAQERLMDQNQDLIDLTVNLEQINKKLEEKQKEVNRQKKLAEEQKTLADDLLNNIFPYKIAEQLKTKG